MSGIPALDVVIGLVFIYLLYSLLVSLIQEIVATNVGIRAKVLQKALIRMLEDAEERKSYWDGFKSRFYSWRHILFFQKPSGSSLAEAFIVSPQIKYLGEDKWHNRPSYLGARNFSKILLDLLKGPTKPEDDIAQKVNNFLYPPDGATSPAFLPYLYKNHVVKAGEEKETLLFLRSLWADAQGDLDKFKFLLEQWFDDTMARVSGWFKRYTQVILFCIGLCIAVLFNVDTIQIVKKLSHDPELRQQMVQYAQEYVQKNPDLGKELAEQQKRIAEALKTKDSAAINLANTKADSIAKALMSKNDAMLKTADSLVKGDLQNVRSMLGLGWEKSSRTICGISLPKPVGWNFSVLIGWLLTALALSMGAPFWFDLLNKLMKLKSSAGSGSGSSETKSSGEVSTIQRKG